jgi:hypothetical protein
MRVLDQLFVLDRHFLLFLRRDGDFSRESHERGITVTSVGRLLGRALPSHFVTFPCRHEAAAPRGGKASPN